MVSIQMFDNINKDMRAMLKTTLRPHLYAITSHLYTINHILKAKLYLSYPALCVCTINYL